MLILRTWLSGFYKVNATFATQRVCSTYRAFLYVIWWESVLILWSVRVERSPHRHPRRSKLAPPLSRGNWKPPAAIHDLTKPQITPFDAPSPKTLYSRTKHEVDRMTRCRDLDILNFPKCVNSPWGRSVAGGRRSVVNILLTLISYTPF